jgi:hypothetical protein
LKKLGQFFLRILENIVKKLKVVMVKIIDKTFFPELSLPCFLLELRNVKTALTKET